MQELKSFFDSVERIALALPRIEAHLADMSALLETIGHHLDGEGKPATAPIVPPAIAAATAEVFPVPPAPSPDVQTLVAERAKAADAEARRDFLKRELRARGVAFAAGARTATLEDLFAKTTPPGSPAAPKASDAWFADTFMPPVEPPARDPNAALSDAPGTLPAFDAAVTREEVRAALVRVSAEKGKDRAEGIVVKVGGQPRFTQVDPGRYPAMLAACKEALA